MECVNAVMEQYIQIYTLYLQNDWMNWLAFAKFTANNFVSETTKIFLFLANYSQHSQMGFKPLNNTPHFIHQTLQITKANKFVKKMKKLQQFFIDKMTWAQFVYKASINKN